MSTDLNRFCLPRYNGESILNVMASIIAARGGQTHHLPSAHLSIDKLSSAAKLAYLVLDGVGVGQLRRYLTDHPNSPFFGRNKWQTITSVFPATTASAVTTFMTGASPAEHGVLNWFLHLNDLGVVSTILPVTTRTGVPFVPPEFDLRTYLDLPTTLESIPEGRALISYDYIPTSRYSRAGPKWDEIFAHKTIEEMSLYIKRFAKKSDSRLAFVYWPGYDDRCHEFGCNHEETVTHLVELDSALAALSEELEQLGVEMIVTADHGLRDVPPEGHIDLMAVPGLAQCLAMLPSGDSGLANLFVRPRAEAKFKQIIEQHMANKVTAIPGEELLERELFGPGTPHSSLTGRVGDYILLAHEGWALHSSMPQHKKFYAVGNHGGMTIAEMEVPLFSSSF